MIEFKSTKKTVKNNFGKTKVITKSKIQKIRIPSVSLRNNGVLFDSKALWVKPIIQKNRIVFFWKGIYIDGATIYGESINRYQELIMDFKKDKEGTMCSKFLDEEGDNIECSFNNDQCVEINTEKYTYITLSISTLEALIESIREAEEEYESEQS